MNSTPDDKSSPNAELPQDRPSERQLAAIRSAGIPRQSDGVERFLRQADALKKELDGKSGLGQGR